ncbi:hypothetical protein ABK040_000172 [Willaertia magna]
MAKFPPLLLLTFIFTLFPLVLSYNNGIGKPTPPLGWNTWNTFGCNINETLIIKTIDMMVKTGLRDVGYEYIVIDDCWQEMERDSTLRLQADKKRFPNGIPYLVNYAKLNGLKLGIYSDVGKKTCQGRPGSFEHYEIDAKTFAEWGIQYLKLDFCNLASGQYEQPWIYYSEMSKALNQTGKPILYSICNWGDKDPWKWAPQISNMWRVTHDIFPVYRWMMHIVSVMNSIANYSGPYSWNDPDMLEVGVNWTIAGGLTIKLSENESKAHFSLWSILNAPLILGNDLLNMPQWVYNIISNREVIAINQDPNVVQGRLMETIQENTFDGFCYALPGFICKYTEIYVKRLSLNRFAVVLFNRGDAEIESDIRYKSEKMLVLWDKHLGVSSTQLFMVRDLWLRKNIGVFSTKFETITPIEPHSAQMFLLTPM